MASTPKTPTPLVTVKLKSISTSGGVGKSIRIEMKSNNGADTVTVGRKAENVWIYQGTSKTNPVLIDVSIVENDPIYDDTGSGQASLTLDFSGPPKKGSTTKSIKVQGVGGDKKKSATFTLTFEWFVTSNVDDVLEYIVHEMKTNAASSAFKTIKDRASLAKGMTKEALAKFQTFDPDGDEASGIGKESPFALLAFKAQVDYQKPWDHKPVIKGHYGQWFLDAPRGTLYNYDIWSNIHYGWIGRGVGFSAKTLRDAAGIAQAMNDGKKLAAYAAMRENTGAELDHAPDQAAIGIGIRLWDSHGTSVTAQDVLDSVRKNKSKLNFQDAPEGTPPSSFSE